MTPNSEKPIEIEKAGKIVREKYIVKDKKIVKDLNNFVQDEDYKKGRIDGIKKTLLGITAAALIGAGVYLGAYLIKVKPVQERNELLTELNKGKLDQISAYSVFNQLKQSNADSIQHIKAFESQICSLEETPIEFYELYEKNYPLDAKAQKIHLKTAFRTAGNKVLSDEDFEKPYPELIKKIIANKEKLIQSEIEEEKKIYNEMDKPVLEMLVEDMGGKNRIKEAESEYKKYIKIAELNSKNNPNVKIYKAKIKETEEMKDKIKKEIKNYVKTNNISYGKKITLKDKLVLEALCGSLRTADSNEKIYNASTEREYLKELRKIADENFAKATKKESKDIEKQIAFYEDKIKGIDNFIRQYSNDKLSNMESWMSADSVSELRNTLKEQFAAAGKTGLYSDDKSLYQLFLVDLGGLKKQYSDQLQILKSRKAMNDSFKDIKSLSDDVSDSTDKAVSTFMEGSDIINRAIIDKLSGENKK